MAYRSSLFSVCKSLICKNSLVKVNSRGLASLTTQNFGKDKFTPEDPKTHTGQTFEGSDDYRLARFIDKPKQVNNSFAIDLIDEAPPEEMKERVVWCEGGGGPLGHPRVYINLDKPGNHICGYCGLRFYKDDKHHH